MSKPALGLLLGGFLGLTDGLSVRSIPAASMIVPIVVGSTIKGLVTVARASAAVLLSADCLGIAREVLSLPQGVDAPSE
jgi:hypothetical protein